MADENDTTMCIDRGALQAGLVRATLATQREIHNSCAALTVKAEKARGRLLQRAARSRAAQLIPAMMDDILHRARRLQRLRNELLRRVQALVRQGNNNSSSNSNSGVCCDALERIWSTLTTHFRKESALINTRHPTGPTAGQFRMFCHTAFVHYKLHMRLQSVSAAQEDDKAQDDIVEEAFRLLLDAMHEGNTATFTKEKKAAMSKKEEEERRRQAQAVIDADANEEASDVEEDNSVPLSESKVDVVSCVELPCLIGLQTYCEDAPWALRPSATSTNTAEGHGTAQSATVTETTLGFIFSPTTPAAQSTSATTTNSNVSRAATRNAKQNSSMDYNSSSSSTLWSGQHHCTGISAFNATDGKHKTRTTAYDDNSTASDDDEGSDEATDQREGLGDDTARLAHVLTEMAVRVVDMTWTQLDPCKALKELNTQQANSTSSSNTSKVEQDGDDDKVTVVSKADKEGQTSAPHTNEVTKDSKEEVIHIEAEEEAMGAVMEILRVRYTCELAAQLLAVELAKRRLLEKETATVFDAGRLVQLSTHIMPSATQPCAEKDTAALLVNDKDKRMPVFVLQLPGLDLLFYCVAYSVGVALLADYTHCASSQPALWFSVFESRYGILAHDVNMMNEPINVDIDVDVDDDEEDALLRKHAIVTSTHSSSWSQCAFARALRLWLYLCEYVFTTTSPPRSENNERDVSCIVLDRERATRWCTSVASTAVQYGLQRISLLQNDSVSVNAVHSVSVPPLLAETEKRAREELLRRLAH